MTVQTKTVTADAADVVYGADVVSGWKLSLTEISARV